MGRFIARRALHAVILVAVTLTITFAVLHASPGDPLTRYIQPGVDLGDVERVRRSLGLDDNIVVQFLHWAGRFLVGDFGVSLEQHRPVRDLLAEAIPRTLLLAGLALAVQIVVGVWAGVTAARHRHTRADRALSIATVALYAIPPFYLAYLLMTAFAVQHGWLPTSGVATPGLDASGFAMLADRARHLVMPVIVLGLASAAGFARFARGSLVDALAEDWVRTARSKGLSERTVVWRHALRGALAPLITIAGLSVPLLLGGAVIVEAVFAWPGMGRLMVDSIYARDYPVVLAVNFIGAAMVILGNFLADLGLMWADPRAALAEDSRRR